MDNRIYKRMKNGMKMRLALLSGLTVFWFLEIFVAFTTSWNTTTMEGSSNNQIPPHDKGYYEVKVEQQKQPPDSKTTRTSSPPLDYVKIDLQKSKSAVSAIRNFLQQCPIIPSFQNATRLSKISHKSSFLTSPPACQELIYHPLILKAVRAVLGHADDDERPIWVFAVTRIQRRLSRGQQTMCHRLHSDMEFSHPSCRPLGGATVWLYLDKDTNQCPWEQLQESPLTFFAGSHQLPQTAQQALSEHGCQSPDSRTPFNCSTADLMRKYSQSYPQYNLHRTMGPKELYRGIAWPSSTWHETRDICGRTSMTLEYVSSVECARHLTYIFPGPTAGTLAPLVDLPPLVPINRAARHAEIDSFMALLSTGDINSMDNRTTGALLNRTCLVKPPVGQTFAASSPAKRAPVVAIDSWHFSGKFKNSTRNFMERIGFSLKPTNEQTIRTAFFEYWLGRTRYICSKRGTLAHPPHSEPSIEVCAVIEGRINYAWAFGETGCSSGFFTGANLRQNAVAIMFPGIFHTASPDADFDGEHMCVKIFSLPSAQQQRRSSSHDFYEQWNRVALEATRIAARSLDVNYTLLLENQRTHDVFYVDRGRNRIDTSNANNTLPGVGQKRRRETDFPLHLPGLSRLHVKVVRYRPNEVSKMGPDKYDMIVLVLEGQLNLLTQQRESGKNSTKTTAIPKHEWLVISAGTSHAFQTANSTENETALVLFIEVAPQ